MINLLEKLKGGDSLPPRATGQNIILAWVGGFLAILVLSGLTKFLNVSLLLGSFGASCVLIFGYPDVPFSQPRNIFFGHVLSSAVGLFCLYFFGPVWWSVAIAVGTSIALMMFTNTVHPPAGSNPVIVFLAHPSWGFILFPTAIGAVILIATALFYNSFLRGRVYPKYW